MDASVFDYTHVIVGQFPQSTNNSEGSISEDARRQHECYVRLIRELGLEVIQLNFTNSLPYPKNVFIEDIAIICNGTALLTTSHNSSAGEVTILRNVLGKTLGQNIAEITDKEAKLNGSDVLFTGREFFVGISDTSNEAGARAVAATFPEFPCTLIKTAPGSHHLKSFITVAGPDILCVSASKEAQDLLKKIEREATFSYQTLTVPEGEAANCLYINGTLMHRAIEEITESFKVFCEKIDFARRSVCFSELAKESTGLSSCCLLVKHT